MAEAEVEAKAKMFEVRRSRFWNFELGTSNCSVGT